MMRVGHGFDVHAFGPGEGLILCGVTVPFDRAFIAHSDGDVALHALTDAMLGAAGLGDIGRHFPDTDPAWLDADSRGLLRDVRDQLRARDLTVYNADLTIVAQAPKLAGHINAMCANVQADLALADGFVNVKATTSERLGFTGRGEGIAAYAVVTVVAL